MANLFEEIEIPNQKRSADSPPFPAVLAPNSSLPPPSLADFISAIHSQKPHLESLLHKTGAILFRGFPVSNASEFDQVVDSFGYADHPYFGGAASRTNVVGRVYTANESPPDRKIPFHHEMAYAAEYPTKLFFFCEVEPRSGGETPMVLSHVVVDKMREKYPEFVERLEKEGMVSRRMMREEDDPSSAIGRGWKSTYYTDDKKVAEQRAEKLGMKLEWIEGGDGSMVRRVIGPVQAIKEDESRGRKIWFNELVPSYTAFGDEVTFGNGEALPGDVVYDCLQMMEDESVAVPWKKGDVLFIDNLAVLHGRKHFTPPRRILAALCK